MTRVFRAITSIPGVCCLDAVLAMSFLALAPVPNPETDNTNVIVGRVDAVTSSCCGDLQIRLEEDARTFYINRGRERGLDPAALQRQLAGKHVAMHLIDRAWSPLDPLHRMAPVAQLTGEGQVLFKAIER